MREIKIKNEILKNNKTVIKYLSKIYPNLSYGTLQKALRNKDIRINDKKINSDCILNENDNLKVYISDELLFNLPCKLMTIYEDDNILVIYKPQGILSNIEEINEKENEILGGQEFTLDDLVKKNLGNYIICHRLDRNTAGIILFAKNEDVHKEILDGFNKNFIHKEYIAYVACSKFEKDEETLEKYLVKNSTYSYVKIHDKMVPNSQKIITKYKVLKKDEKKDFAILNVEIPTGKTHQIRAQLSSINHPIIGDSKYGKNTINKKFKQNKQLLFAYKLSFSFPSKSPLSYLNNKIIKLDSKMYDEKIK